MKNLCPLVITCLLYTSRHDDIGACKYTLLASCRVDCPQSGCGRQQYAGGNEAYDGQQIGSHLQCACRLVFKGCGAVWDKRTYSAHGGLELFDKFQIFGDAVWRLPG